MQRRYDSKTTTFSPQGRLQQVQYAIQAINKTGSSIGILTKEGIILATQKMETSFLLQQSASSDKIYCIDKHLYCVVSGLSADANYLLQQARKQAQDFKLKYRSDMPIQQLIVAICDMKQQYTQFGGLRPFGAAFLFAGYDKVHGFQLYSTDPSGNYAGWKAIAIGTSDLAANSFLKQQYKQGLTLEQGLSLGLKSIIKTMDTAVPNHKKIQIMIVKRNQKIVTSKNLNQKQIIQLLKKNGYQVTA